MRGATDRSRDPDHLALRHAARVGCVGVAVFVGLGWGLGLPEAAGPALFAVYTLGAQAHFAGGPVRRALRSLLSGTVALAMFPLAAAVEPSAVATVAMTGVVVFTALFLGTLGGPFYAARFPVVIAFLFAATTEATGSSLGERMLGWAVGTLAITLGVLVLWPTRARSAVPALTAAVCRRSAAVLDPLPRPADRDALLDASHRLRVAATQEHLHPGAVALDERRWSELVHCAERHAATAALLGGASPARADRELLEATSQALRAVAGDLVAVTSAPRRSPTSRSSRARPLRDALDAHARTEAVDAASDPGATSGVVRAGMAATDTRVVARTALDVAVLADAATGAHAGTEEVTGAADTVDDRPDSALRAQLGLRSLWFRNAVRAAVALMLAVALVLAGTGSDHGFWVALGAFAVLRADLGTITRSAGHVVVGTAVGFVVSSLVVLASDGAGALPWIVFPVALLASVYAERFRPEVGAAAFTVMLVTMYSLAEPAGLRTGELRLVNVTLGAGITLAVGLVLWPRVGRAPRVAVADVVDRARRALTDALAGRPVAAPLAMVTELDRVLDVVATSAPRTFDDRTRARVLVVVDLGVAVTQLLTHPRPSAPVPLADVLRAPGLAAAVATDAAATDRALRAFGASLTRDPGPPPAAPPTALTHALTATPARGGGLTGAQRSAGIRLAAALRRLHDLASEDAPASRLRPHRARGPRPAEVR